MADKREGRRIIKRMRLTFLCGDEEHKGISSNFSDSGLFIKTRKKFKPGSSVNIILESEDIQKINLTGEISRIKMTSKFERDNRIKKISTFDKFNDGIGIKLNEIPQAYKGFLEALIKEHS